MKKLNNYLEIRVKIFLSLLLAGIQIIGYSFSVQNNWNLVFQKKMLIVWLIGSALFFVVISLVYRVLDKLENKDKTSFEITRKKVVILALILLLCWLPYIIIFYPGSANPDVGDQLGQFFHNSTMCWTAKYVNLVNPERSLWNNHHPVFHTLILGLFVEFGKNIGHKTIGLFCLTMIQIILMIGVFAYIILYLKKVNVNKKIVRIIFVFYALWPLAPLTTLSLCKDTFFTICVLIATIMLFHMLKSPVDFYENKKNLIGLIIVFILMGLFRNNGLYLLIVALPIFLLIGKGARKRIFVSFLIPIIFLGVFMPKVVFRAAQIAPGSEKEMLSVPLQQVARVLKEHEKKISTKDKKIIENTMCPGRDYHFLIQVYNPRFADPVKATYNKQQTAKQKQDFLKVWKKYLFRYPGVYIQAAINNNYEYFYYERYGKGVLYYNGITVEKEYFLGMENSPRTKAIRSKIWNTMYSIKENPYIGWIFNIGFYMNIFIIIMVYALIKKKYKTIAAFSLIILNMGINLIGPIVYMRYAYFFIMSIPLILGFIQDEKDIKER